MNTFVMVFVMVVYVIKEISIMKVILEIGAKFLAR